MENIMDTKLLLEQIGRTDIPASERLEALRGIKSAIDAGEITREGDGSWVNNHIHTCYSFSPYTLPPLSSMHGRPVSVPQVSWTTTA